MRILFGQANPVKHCCGYNVQFKDNAGSSKQVYAGTNITIIATPNNGYAFVGWYIADLETLISTDLVYTTAVNPPYQLWAAGTANVVGE